uniref:Uncharacterized protein n=1 Tax=Strongyloides papillosus TaxID=174720 RepID=A0A0N5BS33_STREA
MAPLPSYLLDTSTSTVIFCIGFVIMILSIMVICCTNPPNPRRNGVYIVKPPKSIKHPLYQSKCNQQQIKTVSLSVSSGPTMREGKRNHDIINSLSTTLPVPKSAKLDAIIQFTRHREYDTEYNKSGVKVISCNRSFL